MMGPNKFKQLHNEALARAADGKAVYLAPMFDAVQEQILTLEARVRVLEGRQAVINNDESLALTPAQRRWLRKNAPCLAIWLGMVVFFAWRALSG